MVLVQNGHFSNFFLEAIQTRKISFTIFQNEKMPFQAIKTRSSKSRKIDIFQKGLTHGFGPKIAIFPIIFFRQYRPGKCLLRYSRTKNAFLGFKNKKIKKSKNSHFPKVVNPRFWFKNGRFFQFFFFLDNIGQDNLFYDILEQKTLFQAIKTRCSKSPKIDIFQRR